MAIVQWVTGGLFAVVVGFAVVMSPFAGHLEPIVAPGDWIARKIFEASDVAWPVARLCGTAAWWLVVGTLTVWFVQTIRTKAANTPACRGRTAAQWQS
ncbi:MAG TPA: hypothetical protein VEA69_06495 [Tepidisphaeraceae bacterium]|nr:hypothetical protein [Tepidisphaeraceae bacterium]